MKSLLFACILFFSSISYANSLEQQFSQISSLSSKDNLLRYAVIGLFDEEMNKIPMSAGVASCERKYIANLIQALTIYEFKSFDNDAMIIINPKIEFANRLRRENAQKYMLMVINGFKVYKELFTEE